MESRQTFHKQKKLSIRVTIVGSHLFEPTHYSLVGLLHEIEKKIKDIKVLAKHPMPHSESSTPAPCHLILPKNTPWRPDTDIVHVVSGGETAIRVSNVLDPKIPMIVSFVGGADLSRQLKNSHLYDGYRNLFERVCFVTYPDRFGQLQLKTFGVSSTKMVHIPAALPLRFYEIARPIQEITVVMAGRPISRKNHAMAKEIAKHSKHLRKLVVIGKKEYKIDSDPRILGVDIIPHTELLRLLSKSSVLLQTGDWEGHEVDSLPTIVLEALVMGMSVVSTPLIGAVDLSHIFPDFVRVAETVPELADALDRMLTCDKNRDVLKLRQWIIQQHGGEKVACQILNLYKKILR